MEAIVATAWRARSIRWSLAFAICALLRFTQSSAAQVAPAVDGSADAVAAAVQGFYDQTRDVSAAFFQTYVNKLYQRTDRSQGKVVFKKPGMMRWDYDQPNGKVIASDGKMLRVYEPGEA